MFFKDFVSVKRQKIKRGASQTYDTPSFPDKQSGFGRFCFAYTTIYPLVIAMRSAFLNDKSSSLFITLSLPTANPHQQFVQKTLFIYRE